MSLGKVSNGQMDEFHSFMKDYMLQYLSKTENWTKGKSSVVMEPTTNRAII